VEHSAPAQEAEEALMQRVCTFEPSLPTSSGSASHRAVSRYMQAATSASAGHARRSGGGSGSDDGQYQHSQQQQQQQQQHYSSSGSGRRAVAVDSTELLHCTFTPAIIGVKVSSVIQDCICSIVCCAE
jgi:hypothetical protein